MRRIKELVMLVALLSGAATHVCAQQKAGTFSITPKVGVTVSDFSGKMPASVIYGIAHYTGNTSELITDPDILHVGGVSFYENKSKFGFTAGAEAQYQFTSHFGLSLGAFYTLQGASYDTKGYSATNDDINIAINNDLKVNLGSITVPILANVYVWKGLAVKAGLQPEFAVSKKTSCDATISYEGQAYAVTDGNAAVKTFSLSVLLA